jgi:hypothetical protein
MRVARLLAPAFLFPIFALGQSQSTPAAPQPGEPAARAAYDAVAKPNALLLERLAQMELEIPHGPTQVRRNLCYAVRDYNFTSDSDHLGVTRLTSYSTCRPATDTKLMTTVAPTPR